jgi:hypothetical protein
MNLLNLISLQLDNYYQIQTKKLRELNKALSSNLNNKVMIKSTNFISQTKQGGEKRWTNSFLNKHPISLSTTTTTLSLSPSLNEGYVSLRYRIKARLLEL